jgi:N-methylhydantoinase A
MTDKGYAQLGDEGVSRGEVRFEASLDIRYTGQEHSVTTPVPLKVVGEQAMRLVAKRFSDLHNKQYTFTLADPLEVVNVHLSAFGKVKKPRMRDWKRGEHSAGGGKGQRSAFIEGRGFKKVPVYERDSLGAGSVVKGPAIIEEATSTTIVGGEDRAEIDRFGNVVVEVG